MSGKQSVTPKVSLQNDMYRCIDKARLFTVLVLFPKKASLTACSCWCSSVITDKSMPNEEAVGLLRRIARHRLRDLSLAPSLLSLAKPARSLTKYTGAFNGSLEASPFGVTSVHDRSRGCSMLGRVGRFSEPKTYRIDPFSHGINGRVRFAVRIRASKMASSTACLEGRGS